MCEGRVLEVSSMRVTYMLEKHLLTFSQVNAMC